MYDIPFLDLPPLKGAQGTVHLPGSKSISNRVLLLAALCEGTTRIHDLLDSDDTRVMLKALEQLGCVIEHQGQTVQVVGLGNQRPTKSDLSLFLGNAGTAMRPLTAALAVMGVPCTLSGVARMHERPIGDLVDALRELGCHIDHLGNEGYPPLRLGPAQLKLDRPIPVRGDVSSQFLTALLMALPLAASHQSITIDVVGELISKPYIEITLNLLARFGIHVQRQDWTRFVIPAGSQYRSPGDIHVEADASSASYFIALGAMASGSGIRVQGVGAQSIQGDIRFVEAAQQMGAQITSGPNWLEIRRGAWPLKAIDLDCNHIPDAAMTLAVMGLFADGPTTLRNIASWRVKETDRIAAMVKEARKLGATVQEGPDWLCVHPIEPGRWQSARIQTYDDHRMAMCFSLAALNGDGVQIRIDDPACVAKTFPNYFETLFSVSQADDSRIPVICIDGPTASGKGTLASTLAQRLGYHYLDSGALYRLAGLVARRAGLPLQPSHAHEIASLARQMPLRFEGERVWLGQEDVSADIRSEAAGMDASQVSALPQVRAALIDVQHGFRRLPGLVADGRDMGTVIFPDAELKVYLTADAFERAQRRMRQLAGRGIDAKIDDLHADLLARDARDSQRSAAPLKPAEDALMLDNSKMGISESVTWVLDRWQGMRPQTPV